MSNPSRERRGFVAFDFLRQLDDDAATREIDRWHHGIGERQQHGRALGRRDLDDIAGAEIMDGDDAAERLIGGAHGREPDQIGVVIFVVIGIRQSFARHVELNAVELFGIVARRDPTRRLNTLVPAAVMIGGIVGPPLTGTLLHLTSTLSTAIAMMAIALPSIGVYAALMRAGTTRRELTPS